MAASVRVNTPGKYAILKIKDEHNVTNRCRSCSYRNNTDTHESSLQARYTNNDNEPDRQLSDDETVPELTEAGTDTLSNTNILLRPEHKYISKSGHTRTSTHELKTIEENYHRPITVASSRDVHNITLPTNNSSVDNEKSNLKINSFLRTDVPEMGKLNGETQLPAVNANNEEARLQRHLLGIKTALREKILETGDTYAYFNPTKIQQRSESGSSVSLDIGRCDLSSSPSMVMASDMSDDECGYRVPWENTPEPKPLSISDSDQCDTDLEIDDHFGKGMSFLLTSIPLEVD